jgi:hypothetical protein
VKFTCLPLVSREYRFVFPHPTTDGACSQPPAAELSLPPSPTSCGGALVATFTTDPPLRPSQGPCPAGTMRLPPHSWAPSGEASPAIEPECELRRRIRPARARSPASAAAARARSAIAASSTAAV